MNDYQWWLGDILKWLALCVRSTPNAESQSIIKTSDFIKPHILPLGEFFLEIYFCELGCLILNCFMDNWATLYSLPWFGCFSGIYFRKLGCFILIVGSIRLFFTIVGYFYFYIGLIIPRIALLVAINWEVFHCLLGYLWSWIGLLCNMLLFSNWVLTKMSLPCCLVNLVLLYYYDTRCSYWKCHL